LKALITGISGFVGSHLAEYLLLNRPWKIAGTVYGPTNNITHIQGTWNCILWNCRTWAR